MSAVSVEWAVEDPGAVSAARGMVDLRKQANMSERICNRCGVAPGTNLKGVPLCDDCRVPRKLVHRTCRVCGREYNTKGGNYTCDGCLHQAAKHPCADCGELCDKRATRCLACSTVATMPIGPENPNWRGGVAKIHRTRGYVREKCPGHPRANSGYVPQHTLVMERHIGRYLLPGENVHHKNGVRHDNRIDNLELWVKYQPAGQRAADLLAWAHEIIDRYDPVKAVL